VVVGSIVSVVGSAVVVVSVVVVGSVVVVSDVDSVIGPPASVSEEPDMSVVTPELVVAEAPLAVNRVSFSSSAKQPPVIIKPAKKSTCDLRIDFKLHGRRVS